MKVNLALFILQRVIIDCSYGGQGRSKLSDYMYWNNIPRTTFYRHVNSLLEGQFLVRHGNGEYGLHPEFVKIMAKVNHQQNLCEIDTRNEWMEKAPF